MIPPSRDDWALQTSSSPANLLIRENGSPASVGESHEPLGLGGLILRARDTTDGARTHGYLLPTGWGGFLQWRARVQRSDRCSTALAKLDFSLDRRREHLGARRGTPLRAYIGPRLRC